MSTRKANKRPRKSKPNSKNRWGPKVAHSATRSVTRIAPDELDVKLMYRTAAGLSNGGGGLATKAFHTNAAFDVDPSLGSTETYGFDEYASLYTYYRVIGYSYSCTVVNGTASPILAYALNTNVDPTAIGTAFYLYSTNPHCQSKLISNVSPNMHTFRGRHTIAQITGTTAVETADTYRSLTSTIPSDLTWFTIGVESIGLASVTATFDFKLIMHVRFYSREVDLTISATLLRLNRLVQAKDDYHDAKKRSLSRQLSVERFPEKRKI
jgi:hypothetical protein